MARISGVNIPTGKKIHIALTYIFALKISKKISPWKIKIHYYLIFIGRLILGPIKSTCLTKEEKWVMLYLYLIN